MTCPSHSPYPKGDRCPSVVRAKALARKARRLEKRAEIAAGSLPGHGPAASQDAQEGLRTGVRGSRRRPPRPKRARKPKAKSMSKLKKLLWAEVSQLVRSWSEKCRACEVNPTSSAAHIVPSNSGAATRFFLPNLYPVCGPCNFAEYHQRGPWVYKHREMFGAEYVDALYAMSRETFQIKRDWVLAQTERMKALRRGLVG